MNSYTNHGKCRGSQKVISCHIFFTGPKTDVDLLYQFFLPSQPIESLRKTILAGEKIHAAKRINVHYNIINASKNKTMHLNDEKLKKKKLEIESQNVWENLQKCEKVQVKFNNKQQNSRMESHKR